MTSEAQKRAVKNYKQRNVKRVTVDFHPTEADLYEHICAQSKKQTYIKELIRADMEHSESKKQLEAIKRSKYDLKELLYYLQSKEDTDEALMHNAGLDTYPSVIIERILNGL